MARKDSGSDPTVTFYAPDGSEYPVNGDTLTAVERVNLESRGYSTERPSDPRPVAEPAAPPGPLSGAVPSE